MRCAAPLVIVLLSLVPSSIAAQEPTASEGDAMAGDSGSAVVCLEGRVANADTLGRCCWPSQSYGIEHGRCEGAPRCPPGWAAHGDDCVRLEPSTAAVAPIQVTAVIAPPPPAPTTTIQHAVVGGGVALISFGYTSSIGWALLWGTRGEPCGEPVAGLALVPVVGPVMSLVARSTCSSSVLAGATGAQWYDVLYGTVAAASQILGLVLIGIGAHRIPVVVEGGPGEPRTSLWLELVPTPTLMF